MCFVWGVIGCPIFNLQRYKHYFNYKLLSSKNFSNIEKKLPREKQSSDYGVVSNSKQLVPP